MRKLATLIMVALTGLCSMEAFAQQGPIKSCRKDIKDQQTGFILLQCTVVENGTFISDVVFNRHNCLSTKTMAEKFNIPALLGSGINKTYNFGQLFSVVQWNCPNIIEVTILTNKGNVTFEW